MNRLFSEWFGKCWKKRVWRAVRSHPDRGDGKGKTHSGTIDILITDVAMPEMNGRDLAEKITDLYPDLRIVFMSGYTANVIAHQGVLDDRVAFIQKPFSMADFSKKIQDVLDTAPDKNGMNSQQVPSETHYPEIGPEVTD